MYINEAGETYGISPENYRIKYLDSSDIEELGFKLIFSDVGIEYWKLGKFELKGRAGRKAGEYKNIDGSISIVEEDEPSHQRLAFSVATKFDTELKKASRQRAIKQGWYAYDGKTIYYDEE